MIDVSQDLTVIVQGPINHHGSSTVNLIENLRLYVPPQNIVLSVPIDDRISKSLLEIGCRIIKYETHAPIQDLTRSHYTQNMVSGVRAGLIEANTTFALRVRSDHKDFKLQKYISLENLLAPGLPIIGVAAFGTHHRAIGQFRIGCISDHVHIGRIDNLLEYWSWDQYTERYIVKRKMSPWGFQPSRYKYYMEQVLYFAWRARLARDVNLQLPGMRQWEIEFQRHFGLLNPDALSFNLDCPMDKWLEFSAAADVLQIEIPSAVHLVPSQILRSGLDSLTRWKKYLART